MGIMNNKLLIVDDQSMNREILSEILEDDYIILEAADGEAAIHILKQQKDEIVGILLDLFMPQTDGYEVLGILNDMDIIDRIPVLIISSDQSLKTEKRCFEYGIADFIRKPFDHKLVRRRVNNVVSLYIYKNSLEEKVEIQTRALKNQYNMLLEQAEKLKKSNINIIDVLSNIIESRNFESGEHVLRVKGYTRILADELKNNYPEYGLRDEDVEIITNASALHDIGKIAIRDDILLKPGRLTDDEFEVMKTHTVLGSQILEKIKNVWEVEYEDCCYAICRHHHERYDGKGYPDGLKGEDIPIAAQIVSIADVYDALVHERCYKEALSDEEALLMILNGECGTFSPKLLRCLENRKADFERVGA